MNEHPFKTEKKLKKEALMKEKAFSILKSAENEVDPLKQAKMIKKARDMIFELKTGHKPKYRQHLTKEQIRTASADEINEIAQ